MARSTGKNSAPSASGAAPAPTPAPAPAPVPSDDRAALSVAELAKRILAGEIRPRVGEVRRLAEAALAKRGKGKKAKAAGEKKDGGKKKDGDKKRKLAKIPGQKAKK